MTGLWTRSSSRWPNPDVEVAEPDVDATAVGEPEPDLQDLATPVDEPAAGLVDAAQRVHQDLPDAVLAEQANQAQVELQAAQRTGTCSNGPQKPTGSTCARRETVARAQQ